MTSTHCSRCKQMTPDAGAHMAMTTTGRSQRKSKCAVCGGGKCAFVAGSAAPHTHAKAIHGMGHMAHHSSHGKKSRKGMIRGHGLLDMILPAGVLRDGANFLKGAL